MNETFRFFDPWTGKNVDGELGLTADGWTAALANGRKAAGLVVQASCCDASRRVFLCLSPERGMEFAVASKRAGRNDEIWAVLRPDFEYQQFPVLSGDYVLVMEYGLEAKCIATAQAMASRGHAVGVLLMDDDPLAMLRSDVCTPVASLSLVQLRYVE